MNFDQALSYLLSLGHETLTIKLGLENTETLLEALGNPQRDFPAVQIAGTNGKGSTAVMLDSICRAGGIRTGLFTSPHLISITERIKIAGEPIGENEFARLTNEVRTTAEGLVASGQLETLPTFFEHVTVIALLAFREAKVELAILETGLGGRLDSTTAAQAKIVAITAIAMDHQEYLGNTIEEIAGEKAAIIRPGSIAVIAPQDKRALEIILNRCAATSARPILIRGETDVRNALPRGYGQSFWTGAGDGRCRVTFETPGSVYENVLLGLRGQHQICNAAVAIAVAETLREYGFAISPAATIRGLESASHPGRLEYWPGTPSILFDGAHNPAAARALRNYLDEFVTQPITMIFGVMQDKNLAEMADILVAKADQLILTEFNNPRAARLAALKAGLPPDFDRAKLYQTTSIEQALRLAFEKTAAGEIICVTGSLYLVGAAQQTIVRSIVADKHAGN